MTTARGLAVVWSFLALGHLGCGDLRRGSSSSSSASASSSDAQALPERARRERILSAARGAASQCTWHDDSGLTGCEAAAAFAKTRQEDAFLLASYLFAEPEPSLRWLGLELWQASEGERSIEAELALLEAASKRNPPALDVRLALAAVAPVSTVPDESASVPIQDEDPRRAPIEGLVRSAPVHVRTAVIRVLDAGHGPPWVLALVAEALQDPLPAIRLGALRALSSRVRVARDEVCATWEGVLNDRDTAVRNKARECIAGGGDHGLGFIDDPKHGLMRGGDPRSMIGAMPCTEQALAAAFASMARDREKKLLVADAEAAFYVALVLTGPGFGVLRNHDPGWTRMIPRMIEAREALRRIAKDATSSRTARLTAMQGLGDGSGPDDKDDEAVLATLAKDPDPTIAKAATDRMK